VMREGLFLPLENCISWRRTPFVFYKRKSVYIPHFFYNETIETYNKLFGIDRVCVLKYEDIQANLFQFFRQLETFMNIRFNLDVLGEKQKIKINPSISERRISEQRYKNIINYFQENFPGFTKGKINYEDLVHDLEQAIIPPDLNEKLERAFSGKAYDYF
nr:hypothetical protein [Desulfobacula sp.]